MIHIEGDDDENMNPLREDDIDINFDIQEHPDVIRDRKNKKLLNELK